MSSEPQNIKAVFKTGTQKPNPFTVVEKIEFPKITDDEILVKTVAAGANPTDWKHCFFFPGKFIAGSDAAGIVHSVGKNVKGFQVGDIVSSHCHGNVETRRGMFAEYFIADPIGTLKYDPKTFNKDLVLSEGQHPPSKLDNFEAVAASTLCVATVGLVFTHYFKLSQDKEKNKDKFLLIWGGATSVGVYAIQLAKLIYGLKVVTCASPKNHEFLKQLGADAVFDYRDSEVIKNIKEFSQNKISYVLDAVSSQETWQSSYEATIGSDTKVMTNVLGLEKSAIKLDPQDKRDVYFSSALVYAIFGEEFGWINGPYKVNQALIKDFEGFWYNVLPPYISQIVTPNLRVLKQGVESAEEALQILYAEGNSCEKIVWRA